MYKGSKRKRLGRTYRIRNSGKQDKGIISEGLEYALEHSLKQFLQNFGLQRDKTVSSLCIFNFPVTGRGLKTKQNIASNSTIIRIPEKAILSCQKIAEDEDLSPLLLSCHEKFKLIDVFVLFLLYHKSLNHSQWKQYLQSLPDSYSTLYFCKENEIRLLPEYFLKISNQFQFKIRSCFQIVNGLWKKLLILGKVSSSLNMRQIEWAWFTVNTRCVYLKGPSFPFLKESNTFVLIPYLDMLNHSCNARVVAEFNNYNNSFEIRTLNSYNIHEQVFINYGPHSNFKLFMDYGFIILNNPHDEIKIQLKDIITALNSFSCVPACRKVYFSKKQTIFQNNFNSELSIGWEGHSWNLEVSCSIFLMTEEEMKNWKQVYKDNKELPSYSFGLQLIVSIVENKLKSLENTLCFINKISNFSSSFLIAKLLLQEHCKVAKNYLKFQYDIQNSLSWDFYSIIEEKIFLRNFCLLEKSNVHCFHPHFSSLSSDALNSAFKEGSEREMILA